MEFLQPVLQLTVPLVIMWGMLCAIWTMLVGPQRALNTFLAPFKYVMTLVGKVAEWVISFGVQFTLYIVQQVIRVTLWVVGYGLARVAWLMLGLRLRRRNPPQLRSLRPAWVPPYNFAYPHLVVGAFNFAPPKKKKSGKGSS